MTYKKATLDLAFFEVEDVITTSSVKWQVPGNFPIMDLPVAEVEPGPVPPPSEDGSDFGSE